MTDEGWISRISGGGGELDEQELRRHYYERLSDWSEPGAVKINRGGKLLGLIRVIPKWKPQIPWNRPRR